MRLSVSASRGLIRLAFLLGLVLTAAPWAAAGPASTRLEVNDLSVAVSNIGQIANDLDAGYGLEFPAGTEKFAAYAAGLWVGGQSGSGLRLAIAEFGSDYRPGPIVGGGSSPDTTTHEIFRIVRNDTTGWARWVARAGPLGAPLAPGGTAPGGFGDETMFCVFNDAFAPGSRGQRSTPPIGIEVRLTAYAFDRPGPLARCFFIHAEIHHRGAAGLDSAFVGLFLDPHATFTPQRSGSLPAEGLGYAYRTVDDFVYGSTTPALGWQILRGPLDPATGGRRAASSFVIWPNGSDPQDAAAFYRTMRGFYPWGAAMVAPGQSTPSAFYAPGEPFSSTVWDSINRPHPHSVLAAGPCRLATGDSLVIDAALVLAQGIDGLDGLRLLVEAAPVVRGLFESGFADLPPRPLRIEPMRSWPNPSAGTQRFVLPRTPPGTPWDVVIVDLAGRRVRSFGGFASGARDETFEWDGRDDDGNSVRSGIYLARTTVGGRAYRSRIVRFP